MHMIYFLIKGLSLLAIIATKPLTLQAMEVEKEERRHSTDSNLLGSHHHHRIKVPSTLPFVDAAFGGTAERERLMYELTSLCRQVRANKTADPCYGHHSRPFRDFLRALENLSRSDETGVGNMSSPYSGISVTMTPESWDLHCAMQKSVKDSRDPSTCVAASFVAIPFPLIPASSTFSTPPHPKTPPLSSLKLLMATVITNYDNSTKNSHGKDSGTLPLAISSACRHGIPIHVMGVGIKNFYARGLGGKIEMLINFLRQVPVEEDDNTVVMFIDGTDVLIQDNSTTLLSKFLTTGSRVLFSGEHACYPMKYFPWNLNVGEWVGTCRGACSNSRYICDQLFPKPRNRHRDPTNLWLNSGGFMGFAGDIRRILESASLIPSDMMALWPSYDQGLYTHMLLSRHYNIDIDFSSNIFLSFGMTSDPLERGPKSAHTLLVGEKRTERGKIMRIEWKNAFDKKGDRPSIIHFNGDGKISKKIDHVVSSFQVLHPQSPYSVNKDDCQQKYVKVYEEFEILKGIKSN